MKNPKSLKDVAQSLLKADNILVLSHYNPDCDALGSSLGLYLGLRSLNKNVKIVNESPIVDRYKFLPGISDIGNSSAGFDYQIVVACDCGDRKRFGDSLGLEIPESATIINVDHHASNTLFGTINWIEGELSSTAEMIFILLNEMAIPISSEIATNLLCGIITDTGSFRYTSTSPDTLRAAAVLLEMGADLQTIAKRIYETRSRESVLLTAETLSAAQFYNDGKLVVLTVTQDMLKSTGATLDDTEGLVEEGRAINGVLVSALIKENSDQWQASLRSGSQKIDVSKIAASFGGGGHKAAAGLRWKKSGTDQRDPLIAEIKKILV